MQAWKSMNTCQAFAGFNGLLESRRRKKAPGGGTVVHRLEHKSLHSSAIGAAIFMGLTRQTSDVYMCVYHHICLYVIVGTPNQLRDYSESRGIGIPFFAPTPRLQGALGFRVQGAG